MGSRCGCLGAATVGDRSRGVRRWLGLGTRGFWSGRWRLFGGCVRGSIAGFWTGG